MGRATSDAESGPRNVRRVAALGVVVAVWLGYWWPLLGGGLPYVRDVVLYALPMKHYLVERLAAGELPLWFPHVGAGTPYLADPANQALYPLNVLYLLAPDAHRGLAWAMAAHGLLAGLAAYALALALGVSRGPALWAALVYAYSGYVLSIAENVNYLPGTVWLPAALACLLRGFAAWRAAWIAAAGLCLALAVLAGDVISAVAAVAAGAALAVSPAPAAARRPVAPAGRLAMVAAAAGLGGLLAAAQILPALELQVLSVRAGGVAYDEAVRWSFPLRRLVELAHPYPFGSDYADGFLARALYPDQTRPWADSVYVGAVPLALAAVGAFQGRRGALLAALTLGALALALGRHAPVLEHARALPFFGSQRYPEKLVLLVTLGITMLAGLGADSATVRRWLRGAAASTRARLAGTALAALAVSLPLLVLPLGDPPRAATSALWSALLPGERSHDAGLLLHALVVALVVVVLVWAPLRWRARAFAALLALAVADLVWVHRHAIPTAPSALLALDETPLVLEVIETLGDGGRASRIYFDARTGTPPALRPDNPIARRVRAAAPGDAPVRGESWLRSVLRAHAVLERNVGVLHGVRYLNGGYSPLRPAAHARYEDALGAAHGGALMALAGVGHVVTPITPHALAWDGPGYQELARHAGLNVRVVAVRSPRPRARLAGDAGTVEVLEDRPERIRLRVRAADPAHAVVTESLLPGWEARVDGEPATLALGDGRFMAVPVPAGTHLVELAYRAPGLAAGVVISAAGVLLCMGLALGAGSRRRAGRTVSS